MAFAGFHLLWIGQYHGEPSFQDVENRNPVGSGTFHNDIRNLFFMEPGSHSFQTRDRRIKPPGLTLWLFRRLPGQHATKQKTLTEVNAAATLNDLTHVISS